MLSFIPLVSGSQLKGNRYLIKKFFAEGGFGAVYLVEDRLMSGRLCVLKESFDQTREGRAQFEVEAATLSTLNHPHLVRVTDNFVESNQKMYLVMEYVEGEDLEELLRAAPNGLPEQQVLAWMDQILDAVAYCHAFRPKVIHRDIKPANIRIRGSDGKAILVDFGIAKIGGGQTQIAARGYSRGYAPPEQYGSGTDTYSDIYALGATMYHLLTGRVPVESIDLAYQGVTLQRPRSINPAISSQTEEIILRAMKLNWRDRYQTANDMRLALQGRPICPHCRAENRTGARFCQQCGSDLVSSAHRHPVLAASNVTAILQAVGNVVRVVGKVVSLHSDVTRNGDPFVFLNFGDFRLGCFRAVLWSNVLQQFSAKGIDPESYLWEYLSVMGMVSTYQGMPQIEVVSPESIEVLDQRTAEERLKQGSAQNTSTPIFPPAKAGSVPTPSAPVTPPRPVTPPPRISPPASPQASRPNPVSPPQPVLPSYQLAPDLTARTVGELARQCEVNWDLAVAQFYRGSFESWLKQIGEQALADHGRRIVAACQNADSIQRSEGLAEWLALAGHPGREVIGVARLDLPALGIGETATIKLKISNSGTRYISGVVEVCVPWLSIRQPRFGCKPSGATDVEVTLETSSLIPQKYAHKCALIVKTKSQQVDVPAELTILPPVLQIMQQVLDFGEIRAVAPVRRPLRIGNGGAGYLVGTVGSRVPWLSVPKPEIRCHAGQSVEVQIECDPRRMPLGAVSEGVGLVIDCPHASPPVYVPVAARVILPELLVAPSHLDFGVAVIGTVPFAVLKISCRNAREVKFQVYSLAPWLLAPKSRLSCVADTPSRVLIRVDTAQIGLGNVKARHVLEVEYEAGCVSVGASINVVSRIGG